MASTFFGVQLALNLPRGHDLRQRLGEVVRESRGCVTIPAQRSCWTRASAVLQEAVATADLGSWDLIRSGAENEYEEWASGLEAMAQWPSQDFGEGGDRLLATLIVLVGAGSNADLTLGDACDIPEAEWHYRRTYRRLVAVPPTLNFTNVRGNGLYLAPNPDQAGFSRAVLTGEGFEYLRAVIG
jgi:hypothetical protein